MDDTIHCNRCGKDIEDIVYIEHRNAHRAGYQPPKVVPATTEREPYDPDTYTPPWRKGSVALSSDGTAPAYNTHMVQVQPRADKRPAALDEAIERERNKPRERPSGHSLIR